MTSSIDHSIHDHSIDAADAAVLNGPNRLKLGVFGANLSCGVGALTTHPNRPMAGNWEEMKGIAVAAEEATFEALVPVARWLGFGGESRWWDRSFDTFVWGSGIAEATSRIHIFTTCHVPVFHPVMAAKMGATLDHIAGGRWGLNVVAGWNREEFEMFGIDIGEHQRRYDVADEWMRIIDRLWTEDQPFDFEGDFFHLAHALSEPKPLQRTRPVVMNAGSSVAGQRFALDHADMLYINIGGVDDVAAEVAKAKQDSSAGSGREIAVWGNLGIVCEDTEEEAQRYVRYLLEEVGDLDTATRYAANLVGSDASAMDPYRKDADLVRSLMLSGGNRPLVGTPEQIAEGLSKAAEAGLDGIALTWADYHTGIPRFAEQVLPLLRDLGLRADKSGTDLSVRG